MIGPQDIGAYRGGSGSPLVLLHGAAGSWRIWKPVLPLLERSHELFVPTLPGHRGGDPLPAGAGSVSDIADMVAERLDAAGVGAAHLVGNSLGGAVALELARRGRGLSVVAIAPFGGWRTSADRELLILKVRSAGLVAGSALGARLLRRPRVRKILLRSVMERGDRIPIEAVAEMLADLDACTALSEVITAVRRDGKSAQFALMDHPVRIAWPQHDRTLPFRRYGAPLLERLPRAELVWLTGCGHVPMYDDPTLVARSILDVTTASSAPSRPSPGR